MWFFKIIFIFIITSIPSSIGIASSTLPERKAMASFQSRRGPNTVGFLGFLQPLADGIKLFSKETIIPYKSNIFLYIFAPFLSLSVSLITWFITPNLFMLNILHSNVNLLLLFGLSGLNVYGIIISGWSSNSNYALLGALRSSAQMISYEVSLSLLFIPIITLTQSLNIIDIINAQSYFWFCFLFPVQFIFFTISMSAETNRTPFDLPEAEAEPVSGYNVEYSSLYSASFSPAEYSNILLISSPCTTCFLGGPFFTGFCNFIIFLTKYLIVISVSIWVRSTYPRYRFDQLMNLGWNTILPFNLCFILFPTIYIY